MSKRFATSPPSSSSASRGLTSNTNKRARSEPSTWFREYRSLLWLIPVELLKEIVRLYGLLLLKQPNRIFNNVQSYLGKRTTNIPTHWADPAVLKSYDILFPFLESSPTVKNEYMSLRNFYERKNGAFSNLQEPVWDPHYDRYVYKVASGRPDIFDHYLYERLPKLLTLYLFYQTYKLSLKINLTRD